MESHQLVTGVTHIPPHRGITPLPCAVSVETQMQFDEQGHIVDQLIREPQCLHALTRHPCTDDLVVMERDPTIGFKLAGAGLTDVVQQSGQTQGEIGFTRRFMDVLQRDRLLQHDQTVLIHVLMAMVFILFQSQERHFGQDPFGNAGIDEQGESLPWTRCHHEFDEFIAHPLGRDDLDPIGHLGHRRDDIQCHIETQLGDEPCGPHHAQWIVTEGDFRRLRGAQDPSRAIIDTAVFIDEGEVGQFHGHGIDGEVTSTQIADQAVTELDGWFP